MNLLFLVILILLVVIYLKSKSYKKINRTEHILNIPKKKRNVERKKYLLDTSNYDRLIHINGAGRVVTIKDVQKYIDRFNKAWEPVGNLHSQCPYCGYKFETIPNSKRKCTVCKKTIYPRRIPQSKKRSILREEDLPVLKIQKDAITYSNTHISEKDEEYESAYNDLKKQFGSVPGKNDVFWRILNIVMVKTSLDKDFGLFTAACTDVAQLLRSEKRFFQSLQYYLYICYLDINGATNGMGNSDMYKYGYDQESFQKEYSLVSDYIIERINKLRKLANLSLNELEEIYYYSLSKNYKFPYPIFSNEESWKILKKAMKSFETTQYKE